LFWTATAEYGDPDAEAVGMTPTQHGWQLETTSAELYERFLVPTVTLPWARDLVERVGLRPAQRVLDVACGTGAVARLAASAVGEGGRVAAVDVNRGMLDAARSLPVPAGAAIEWHHASADALPFGDGEFDVVLCQLGLQFFPDRPAAVREMRRVLADRGLLGASVFTSIERNPAACALADAVDRHVGPEASRAKRSEHSLSDPGELRAVFEAAGFDDVRLATATLEIRFRSVEEWVEIQFTATPLADLLADCDERERRRIVGRVSDEVAAALPGLARADAFAFPQEVYVVLADA
jgi:ubiquinone/menaquinone biosynthesis C-methylase UbiE